MVTLMGELIDVRNDVRKGVFQTQKNRLAAAYDITTIALIILELFSWYPGRDLNPHSHKPRDFKSLVSTDFTTRARENWRRVPESNRTRRICNPLHNRFVNAP